MFFALIFTCITLLTHMKKYFLFALPVIFFSAGLAAQTISPDILTKKWDAYWITADGASQKDYGVYHFRKVFFLADKPASFIVHVSADNRYKLYVNGIMASLGPARADVYHWNFETVDI